MFDRFGDFPHQHYRICDAKSHLDDKHNQWISELDGYTCIALESDRGLVS